MGWRAASPGRTIVALGLGVLVGVLVVIPLGRLVVVVWSEGRTALPELLADPRLARAVANALLLAAAVTLAAVPAGAAAALGLARADVPGRSGWRLALLMPVLVPDFVL